MRLRTRAVDRNSPQSGVSLIEVLVAVFVVAFGLLGIAGLQTSALTNSTLSSQYTTANVLAQDMINRMLINRAGMVDPANYYSLSAGVTPSNPPTDCSTTPCSAGDLAQWDLAYWYGTVSGKITGLSKLPSLDVPLTAAGLNTAMLPNGAVSVSCADNPCDTYLSRRIVTVYWNSSRTVDSTSTSYYGCDPTVATALRCVRQTTP